MSVENLLPQKGEMVLIDTVIRQSNDSIECLVTATLERVAKFGGESLPAWVLFESLAQAAALIGALSGRKITKGFLLGSRELCFERELIAEGTELLIRARRVVENGNVSAFEGEAVERGSGAKVLSGVFTVYEEEEADQSMGEVAHE